MNRLASFLPVHLRRRLLGNAGVPALPSEDRFAAALLFSDISGFTALTEKLQERGREGAEDIVALVGTVLGPAVDQVHRWGGSVVNFAGDGLFAVFFPDVSPVRRAEACAEGIRSSFEKLGLLSSSVGRIRLRMSQCIHWGTVTAMHVGRPGQRWCIVAGPAVRALARSTLSSRQGRSAAGARAPMMTIDRRGARGRRTSGRVRILFRAGGRQQPACAD